MLLILQLVCSTAAPEGTNRMSFEINLDQTNRPIHNTIMESNYYFVVAQILPYSLKSWIYDYLDYDV